MGEPKQGFSDRDRRRHKRAADIFIITYRLKTPFDVAMRMGDKEYAAVAMDVGEGGIGVDVGQEVPAGTGVRLKFKMVNEFSASEQNKLRKFELDGESRYCVNTDKQSFRVGILFKNLTPDDVRFIAEYVKDQALKEYK